MTSPQQRHKIILIVSIVSAIINALLAIFKIIVGKIGHSQALIADGIHSFSDLVSDALVYVAARASGRAPDSDHPYGHQRIETIATIIVALLLFGIGGSICYEAINTLLHASYQPKPTFPVIIVAVCSIFANEWLFYFSNKKGKEIHSNLLISNAWHNRTDVFVSALVLLSAIGSISGLPWLDATGAIVIAILIIRMGGKMAWISARELIDTGVDEKQLAKIEAVIKNVPGVESLHQLRTRLHGSNIFIDCHIIVDPHISVSEGHHIGEHVHLALLNQMNHVIDVTVHIDPEDDETNRPSIHLPNRDEVKLLLKKHCANLPGFNAIQTMTLHYLAGELSIELHIPSTNIEEQDKSTLAEQYQQALASQKDIKTIRIHLTENYE